MTASRAQKWDEAFALTIAREVMGWEKAIWVGHVVEPFVLGDGGYPLRADGNGLLLVVDHLTSSRTMTRPFTFGIDNGGPHRGPEWFARFIQGQRVFGADHANAAMATFNASLKAIRATRSQP